MKKKKRRVGRPLKNALNLHADTRSQIVEAFLQVAFETGIENVTLQKVAKKCGVAIRSVSYHFQRQGLTLSQVALDFASAKNYEYITDFIEAARTRSDYDPILAYVDANMEWIKNRRLEASFLAYFYYLSTTKTPLTIENSELVEIGRNRVQELLNEGARLGRYKLKPTSTNLGIKIHAILTGFCLFVAGARDDHYRDAQRNLCISIISDMLKSS